MKYIALISEQEPVEFTLGQLAATKKSVAIRDADGSAYAFKGGEIIAVMRADFAELYEANLAELEALKNRNGH